MNEEKLISERGAKQLCKSCVRSKQNFTKLFECIPRGIFYEELSCWLSSYVIGAPGFLSCRSVTSFVVLMSDRGEHSIMFSTQGLEQLFNCKWILIPYLSSYLSILTNIQHLTNIYQVLIVLSSCLPHELYVEGSILSWKLFVCLLWAFFFSFSFYSPFPPKYCCVFMLKKARSKKCALHSKPWRVSVPMRILSTLRLELKNFVSCTDELYSSYEDYHHARKRTITNNLLRSSSGIAFYLFVLFISVFWLLPSFFAREEPHFNLIKTSLDSIEIKRQAWCNGMRRHWPALLWRHSRGHRSSESHPFALRSGNFASPLQWLVNSMVTDRLSGRVIIFFLHIVLIEDE